MTNPLRLVMILRVCCGGDFMIFPKVARSFTRESGTRMSATILRVNEALAMGYLSVPESESTGEAKEYVFGLENVVSDKGEPVPYLCRNVPVEAEVNRAGDVITITVADAIAKKLLARSKRQSRAHQRAGAAPRAKGVKTPHEKVSTLIKKAKKAARRLSIARQRARAAQFTKAAQRAKGVKTPYEKVLALTKKAKKAARSERALAREST